MTSNNQDNDVEADRKTDDKTPDGTYGAITQSISPDKTPADMEINLVPNERDQVTLGGKIIKQIKRKIPILTWLPKYNLDSALSDLIAGVTVGLTVIPQGIAYALVAGLAPEYGLYSAFMGCFVYCFFGSSKDITIGPTAIMALMTGAVFKEGQKAAYGQFYAVLLAFFTGVIIFICGVLQLGVLVDFISVPVIAGFTSAAAITIASGQIKGLLGLDIPSEESSETHAGIVDYYIDIVNFIDTARWQDATLGIICAIVLLSLRFLNRTDWFKVISPGHEEEAGLVQRITNKLPPVALSVLAKLVWFVCTARNAIVVIFCLIMAALLDPDINVCKGKPTNCTFTLTGKIDAGIPQFEPPPFSIPANSTDSGPAEDIGFGEMASQLGSAFITIPIIAIIESVAIAKAFAGGKPVDASQEMIALGICNMLGSFVHSMPTTGSFSRTAVNSASGVKTSLGGIYTGGLVILCLAFLMPYCAFIPKATLSAVIMTAVIFSVEPHVILPIWSSKKMDLLPGFACFFFGLFYELDYCIFAGVGLHLILSLYSLARPKLTVEVKQVPGHTFAYLSVSPDQAIIFPSSNYTRTIINKAGVREGRGHLPVVVDCSHINQTDFTAATGFKSMLDDFQARSQPLYWLRPSQSTQLTIRAIMGEGFLVLDRVEDLVMDSPDNLAGEGGNV